MKEAGLINRYRIFADEEREDHGTVSSGTEDFSAKSAAHTITTAGSHTWTFSDFSEKYWKISVQLTVSGGGAPTITLPGAATIASDSAQTLSAMADGVYDVEVASFDNDTTYIVLVGKVS